MKNIIKVKTKMAITIRLIVNVKIRLVIESHNKNKR